MLYGNIILIYKSCQNILNSFFYLIYGDKKIIFSFLNSRNWDFSFASSNKIFHSEYLNNTYS